MDLVRYAQDKLRAENAFLAILKRPRALFNPSELIWVLNGLELYRFFVPQRKSGNLRTCVRSGNCEKLRPQKSQFPQLCRTTQEQKRDKTVFQ